ncbi:MAG: DUF4124 domain-containing protein [Gammaproteobacteria bacterium]|nr:DUF4124 domain-containing protein [Gammaproteobacteria bacterium]
MKPLSGLISSLAILTLFSFSMTKSVFAEKTTEIYKWTDEEGRVHYAARPGDDSAEKMHLGSRIFHKQKKAEDNTEATDKQDEERAKLCQDSKDTVAKYKRAPFLYRYDEQRKQKVRLTEQESKEAFLQAEKDVSYWCKPPQQSAESEEEN